MAQTFGALLRQLRRKNRMTQAELAERLGYSRSMVAALETNRRLPDVNSLYTQFLPALNLGDSRTLVEHMAELVAQVRLPGSRTVAPLAVTVSRERNGDVWEKLHIPLLPSRLIGRKDEVENLVDQVLNRDVRLVTLIGPPGVGKTTLALAVATQLQIFLSDGACFVPLAGVTNPDVVPSAILEALAAGQFTGAAADRLVSWLRHKEVLLVLDNFEQILDGAPTVAQVLAECPGVRIIVTSRERLHLRAEHLYRVQPLPIDDAVRLFLARAAAVSSRMAPEEADQTVSEAICRRLDCLPLAIELCAAQAEFATQEEILAGLQSRTLESLVDGSVDLPPRQRTLRAAIESSYQLLGEIERRLFQALSVFVGGCTQAMAEAVWTDDPATASLTGKLLRGLASKSLIRLEKTEWDEQRVLLLESVREFARERLEIEGDVATARARHFDAVSRHMRQADHTMWLTEGGQQHKRILREQENLYAAFQWAYEREEWAEIASLLVTLADVFDFSARQEEYCHWYEVLLPHASSLGPELAVVFNIHFCYSGYGRHLQEWRDAILSEHQYLTEQCQNPLIRSYAMLSGADLGVEYPDAMATGREAIRLAENAHTTEEHIHVFGEAMRREVVLAKALFIHACGLFQSGDMASANAAFLASHKLGHVTKGYFMPSWVLGYLGRIALIEGNREEAIAYFESALEDAIARGYLKATATWRAFLGFARLHAGDRTGARHTLNQAWEQASVFGDPFTMQLPSNFLAELALTERNPEEARWWLARSIGLSEDASRDLDTRHIHRVMLAAQLAACEGRDERAVQLYGFMQAYVERILLGPMSPVIDTSAPLMAEAQTRMGDVAYTRAYNEGRLLEREATLHILLGGEE